MDGVETMGRAWFRGKIPGFEREIRSGSNRRSSDQIDPFEPERTGVRSSPPSSPSEVRKGGRFGFERVGSIGAFPVRTRTNLPFETRKGGGAIHPRPLLEPDIDTSLSEIPIKSPSCIDILWA